MSAALMAGIVAATARARGARRTRDFRHSVSDFVRVLGSIPDEPARSLSNADARVIGVLSEEVIDLIEAHVGEGAASAEAQTLVTAIYEIRRLLEEMNRWRNHYAIARHL